LKAKNIRKQNPSLWNAQRSAGMDNVIMAMMNAAHPFPSVEAMNAARSFVPQAGWFV
jgi:hypothetical protein